METPKRKGRRTPRLPGGRALERLRQQEQSRGLEETTLEPSAEERPADRPETAPDHPREEADTSR